ncbi:MAG: hypothetical protein GXY58_15405 [Planctomycetaceae bacterium]|nr:hypothetical protein [Planctomycetaceae bacterium]
MMDDSPRINDLDDLRSYVQETICERNELETNAYTMTERILIRAGRPCGLYFCLHGPRAVKFTAIWETDRNSVLFYGPTGERIERAQLTQAPNLVPQAA